MALSDSDRSIVERWTGPVASADEAGVEARIARLGSAYIAALEILMIARAEMRRSATKVSSGDDRIDHTANLKALDDAIAELVAAITNDDTITPTDTGQALVDQASGAKLDQTSAIDVIADNPRRG